jgi:DtxR family transcriptional regulator, Mn-dependent transcriptional regulator
VKANRLSPIIEEYLETIFKMELRQTPLLGARLAERMGVSAPTVTGVLKRMSAQGFLAEDERKRLYLTSLGKEWGERMVRRHRLAERLLTDILGMDIDQVHDEACSLEHALSPAVEERLMALLGYPTTCPHGQPIPGALPGTPMGLPLSAVTEIGEYKVMTVPEEDNALLKYLKSKEVKPGARLRVVEIAPFHGPISLITPEGELGLGIEVASQIWVDLVQ